MAKITYLLGAGASAGSLPTVDQFEKEIGDILQSMQSCKKWLNATSKRKSDVEVIDQAYRDLSILLSGCIKHRSVDTFAKKLFLTSDTSRKESEYRIVKCSIILFLNFIDSMHVKPINGKMLSSLLF